MIAVPLKPCCGLLVGDVCDCARFAAEAAELLANPLFLPAAGASTAAATPSTTYPKPLILTNVGGLLRPVEATP